MTSILGELSNSIITCILLRRDKIFIIANVLFRQAWLHVHVEDDRVARYMLYIEQQSGAVSMCVKLTAIITILHNLCGSSRCVYGHSADNHDDVYLCDTFYLLTFVPIHGCTLSHLHVHYRNNRTYCSKQCVQHMSMYMYMRIVCVGPSSTCCNVMRQSQCFPKLADWLLCMYCKLLNFRW